jgi:hypothetical protein
MFDTRMPVGAQAQAHELNSARFYQMVDLAKSVKQEDLASLDAFVEKLGEVCNGIDEEADALAKANNAMAAEQRATTRRKNALLQVDEGDDPLSDLRNSVGGDNFLKVIFDVVRAMQHGFRSIHETAQGIRPGKLVLGKKRHDSDEEFESFEALQNMLAEFQMNSGTLSKFLSGIMRAESAKDEVVNLGRLLAFKLDHYYQILLHRHSVEGIKIHRDPVTTDLAMSIYANVDAHGEIADGKKPNEVSAYSIRKATIIADTIKSGLVGEFIRSPERLIEYIVAHVKDLYHLAETLSTLAKPLAEEARKILGPSLRKHRAMAKHEFEAALASLTDLDPRNVTFKERTGLLTSEERFELGFRNETIAHVAKLLDPSHKTDALIQYILERKAELRAYYQDENSFYVCRVGSGNPFMGVAPGELEVIPATRPVVSLAEIRGSGFDEVKSFIGQIEKSAKWYDLFVATSPSRSGDKSNVLLIGPQGCGKSEILRAVGGDKKSLGIFATGSDFLTCWKGEAEKNPKRLFEAALRLQKESKKHVHILIDEIDTILNKDSGRESFGGTNLVTEFQNLMDGVVHYPHISVWGATNNPERLPVPCLRRFSKALIVGELAQHDRVELLQHFTNFMPTKDFDDEAWNALAKDLDGATGDVMRKVVDYVWREKMSAFVEGNPEHAQTLDNFLNLGDKFDIKEFTEERRNAFKILLGRHMQVSPNDVAKSIEVHLETVSIHHEIKTAKETYSRAKKFLTQLKGNGAKPIEAQA